MLRSVIGAERCVWRREKKNSYLAFLDISEAYDNVWREGLWYKMRQYGVEENFVGCLKDYTVEYGGDKGGVEWRKVKVVCGGKRA